MAVAEPSERPLLIYFPGSDGTGCSIAPQLQGLLDAGFDVRCALRARVCPMLLTLLIAALVAEAPAAIFFRFRCLPACCLL